MNINPKQLSELIQASVKKALRDQLPVLVESEMRKFKKELLAEQRDRGQMSRRDTNTPVTTKPPVNRTAPTTRPKVQPKSRLSKYSNDPYLNELLSSTIPITENTYMSMFMDDETENSSAPVNLPTTEAGNPIQNVPKHVLDVMNRDYSKMFKEQTSNPAYLSTPKQSQPDKSSQVRNMLKSMVIDEPTDQRSSDDEDFSWLDGVQ